MAALDPTLFIRRPRTGRPLAGKYATTHRPGERARDDAPLDSPRPRQRLRQGRLGLARRLRSRRPSDGRPRAAERRAATMQRQAGARVRARRGTGGTRSGTRRSGTPNARAADGRSASSSAPARRSSRRAPPQGLIRGVFDTFFGKRRGASAPTVASCAVDGVSDAAGQSAALSCEGMPPTWRDWLGALLLTTFLVALVVPRRARRRPA